MLAGFCGTLMTPMAANFNLVPAALLELKDKNAVIRAQIPTALPLLAVNIGLLSFTIGLLARHAAREPHLRHPDRPVDALSRHQNHHLYLLPAVTVVAALLAFAEPYLAVGALVAEFVVFGWLSARRR